jgi:hypothetical protein
MMNFLFRQSTLFLLLGVTSFAWSMSLVTDNFVRGEEAFLLMCMSVFCAIFYFWTHSWEKQRYNR